jgi:uncharacterized membrane protein YphA (DoxX/SURF4 family)
MESNRFFNWLLHPPVNGSSANILIRFLAGSVFLTEGIIKFLFTNQGVGRFTKIGIPFPDVMAPFIACLEIVGGLLLIAGYLTRVFSILFIIQMLIAILSTKIAVYLGTSPIIKPQSPPLLGIWAFFHETRIDYAQIMTVIFLLLTGPGKLSIDAWLRQKK